MKKILIITYYWPPNGGSGVQRWVYFSKYLNNFGFEPIILTVDPKKASYKNIDESLNEKVKHLKKFTTNTLEPLKLYSYLMTGDVSKGLPMGDLGTSNKGFFSKLFTLIRLNLFIPDARRGWNYFTYSKAKKIIKDENIDLIISTGPPHSTHLVGLKLKNKYNIKWVADFRDPWTEIFYNKNTKQIPFIKNYDKKLELKVLETADLVLSVGPSMCEMLSKKSNKINSKFIYNGFDMEMMDKIEPNKIKSDFFEIAYIGILGKYQPSEPIIEILKHLSTNIDLKVRFTVAGDWNKELILKIKKIKNINFVYLGRIEHEKAIQIMKNSNLLINSLAEDENSYILISGKLMEYIATKRPILCIGNTNGDAAFLLDKIPNAEIYEKSEKNKIKDFVSKIAYEWKENINYEFQIDVKKYSRFETTRELSKLLKELVEYV